jgi:hypothetical protein
MNVSWYYDWEETEQDTCTAAQGGEFVPMIWGHTGNEQSASGIEGDIAGFVSLGYKYVLGFNEPDNATQSDIPEATAIALLPAFNNPSVLVGTPATQGNATGLAWFEPYMAAVEASSTLRADVVAIHWYGWNSTDCDPAANNLNDYITTVEAFTGTRPIWLTEWGCLNASAPTAAGVVSFFQGALAVFARHPRLQRYAWYQWSTNCELVDADAGNGLTSLGTVYAAAPAFK